jgi:hypothetical protein
MYNGLKYLFVFSVGAALGAVVTQQILKPKYEKMVQEEVNAFKNDWSDREDECGDENVESDQEEYDENYSVPELASLAAESATIITREKYAEVLKKGGSNMSDDDPYVISPLKFAEENDYETISLTYYQDGGWLVDDTGELVEDIQGTVGMDFPGHFGEYTEDPDTVYVRNDRLEVDYEIQLDIGTYVNNRNLNPMDKE